MDTAQILQRVKDLGPEVELAAATIEAERRLPDALVEALRDAGAFRIGFPAAWGGPEMDILSECRMIEDLAYHDASAAWVVMICSDSGHYAARLDEEVARTLYPSLDLLTAGLLYPAGQARRVEGGFQLSGRWSFGSGCQHADRIVGGAMLFDGDDLSTTADGRPDFRVFWLPREQVEIHDTWHTTGLAGSGSHDYSITEAFVPEDHQFRPLEAGSRPEPLYRYRGFFFANLPAVAIGAAQRMLDDLRDLAAEKLLIPSFTLMKDESRVRTALSVRVS